MRRHRQKTSIQKRGHMQSEKKKHNTNTQEILNAQFSLQVNGVKCKDGASDTQTHTHTQA